MTFVHNNNGAAINIIQKDKFQIRPRSEQSPLFLAAKEGDLKTVQLLFFSESIKLELDGWSPIHVASNNGHLQVVMFLFENGLSINEPDCESEETPLHLACSNNQTEVARFLIENGANINSSSCMGETPLHEASRCGCFDIVKILVENGACLQAINIGGRTPFTVASGAGHLNIMKFLLEKEPISEEKALLPPSTFSSFLQVVNFLFEECTTINRPDYSGWSPLHLAAANGQFETVKFLVKNGADCAQTNILFMSQYNDRARHPNSLGYLFEDCITHNQSNDCGWTPLHLAVESGSAEIVSFLVNNNYDVNQSNLFGITPLFIASAHGYSKIVKILIENGANVNILCCNAMVTPLYIASTKGYYKIVRLLVENGAHLE